MNNNNTKLTITAILFLVLSACGGSHPKLTHFKAFDERFTTVIDTSDPATLKDLGDMFFDQVEATGTQADFDFVYLIDVSTAAGSERYRCTKTGYCQLRTEGAEMQREIVYLERYRELYDLSNLN
ncbi:hypothetical protein ACFODZ_14125 [Marinicella sediminis]|uniref:Lipoprotein n=1 Tax=Marinicella sediminis TaxID=1792834 RepID=A0ABV7JJ40_9GAMM|nr:hypothetical protein [Marinicella sediminis]